MKNTGLYLCTLLSVGLVATEAGSFVYRRNSERQASLVDFMNQAHKSEPSTSDLVLPDLKPINYFPKLSAVHFVTNDSGQVFGSFPEFKDDTPERCKIHGYILTSCAGGSPVDVCPYNSSYFKSCCSADYKYKAEDCIYPLTRSSESCGGKYKCYCDTSLYPYTGCTAPMQPLTGEGASCVLGGKTFYAECVCPDTFNETCEGKNLQGKGMGCTKDGTTKYTGCECKTGYNLTCSGDGRSPATPTDYCLKDGIKYYNNCKNCENRCSLVACPAGTICEYEDCSKKYCPIGCAVTHTSWCKQPVTDCMALGYTKTAGECTSYGYIKCPYNETAVFCDND